MSLGIFIKLMSSITIKKLYSKWDQLKEEAKQDCPKLNFSAMQQNFNLSDKNIKWLNYQQDWEQALIGVEIKRKNVKRELTLYYRGYDPTDSFELRLETKDELALFIESDERYEDILEQATIVKGLIIYCEDVIDKLKSKSFEIKNYIEWMKYCSGS